MYESTPASKQNPNIFSLLLLKRAKEYYWIEYCSQPDIMSSFCILIASHIHTIVLKVDWLKTTRQKVQVITFC